MTQAPLRPRNDNRQYDDLSAEWWRPRGRFAMLHWIAAARAALLPPTATAGDLLLDVACGGGVMAPHVARLGYRHVGVDLSPTAVEIAAAHGVHVTRARAQRLPFPDEQFAAVSAGEVLEHVPDPDVVIAECCRVLQPGGTLVIDTIAATWWGRFSSITVGERIPAGPPPRMHDPALFVDRDALRTAARRGGVELRLNGLRPSARDYVWWLAGRRQEVRMLRTALTAGLFQGVGVKETR